MDEDGPDKKICIRIPPTGGPRPYKCDVCQRSFREVATLRKHEQLHRADRPYICQTCGKSFLWSSNLKVHERVHTGERPYKCKICCRCFTQSNDLRRHERNVHMRGKLVNYRPHPGQSLNNNRTGHVSLATYQAFAMQQRAILQHALTYESFMQNAAAVSQGRFMQSPASGSECTSAPLPPGNTQNDLAISTSSETPQHSARSPDSIKLEQVTPPSSPGSNGNEQQNRINERSLSDSNLTKMHEEKAYMIRTSQASPEQKSFGMSVNSGAMHSPPSLPSSTYQGYSVRSHSVNGSPPTHLNRIVSPFTSSAFRFSEGSAGLSNTLPQSQIKSLPPISSLYASHIATSASGDNKVIDLSMNKSVSSEESEDGEWKGGEDRTNSVCKSPPISETESEEKRDVTTTSITPTADSGIHHCPHCNIFFHDFTMYHLHKSLHSPIDDDPFRCPSCQKNCQDRIEFMFHIVWHVKYPHTIPNYEPFRENYHA